MKNFFLPFRGVFCRVSPIAFDGTLSFLELVAKLQKYVNELNSELNELQTTLEEFEAYVNTALDGKQDTLTFDSVPTDGSTNPVESNGIYDALAGKQDTLTFDSVPTDGSTNPVESNGIYDALAGKQDTLTFDIVPLDDSNNPVYSSGIKQTIDAAYNKMPIGIPVVIDSSISSITSPATFAEAYSKMHAKHSWNYLEVTDTATTTALRRGNAFAYPLAYDNSVITWYLPNATSNNETMYISVSNADVWTITIL